MNSIKSHKTRSLTFRGGRFSVYQEPNPLILAKCPRMFTRVSNWVDTFNRWRSRCSKCAIQTNRIRFCISEAIPTNLNAENCVRCNLDHRSHYMHASTYGSKARPFFYLFRRCHSSTVWLGYEDHLFHGFLGARLASSRPRASCIFHVNKMTSTFP